VNRVEVVAAVLQRPDRSFLLAQRPAGKVYAGYWEFPGGKIEQGESADDALARELQEELGIQVKHAYPWITRDYDYDHAAVRLRFHRVTQWSGELRGRENQQFAWQHADALTVSPLLPANYPILSALALPTFYGISNAAQVGIQRFLRGLELALQGGLRLVQIREKTLPESELEVLVTKVLALARRDGASVLLNGDDEVAKRLGVDGVHLTAARLMMADARPDFKLVGASCHDERELARAAQVGVDFVVLGPVAETATHPGARTLGWNRFRELITDYSVPVYAVGGLRDENLPAAWEAGAHGIAAIRGSWPDV
jgi:8-oxo-dGTP diphosphatase